MQSNATHRRPQVSPARWLRNPPVIARGKSERRARKSAINAARLSAYRLWCQMTGADLTYPQWQHAHMRAPFERVRQPT